MYLKCKTKLLLVDGWPVSFTNLVQVGPRIPEICSEVGLIKTGGKNVLNHEQLSCALLDCVKIWYTIALCTALITLLTYQYIEPASQLKLRTTGGTGNLKWQCSTNCHLFWFMSI